MFRIYLAADGWRWRYRTRNGRIMADGGEAYASRSNANRARARFVALMQKEKS